MHDRIFNWEGKGILIADDDNYSHLLLDKVIKKTGAAVFHAYNGKEALEQINRFKEQIGVAIIDLIMPFYNGYEVVELSYKLFPNILYIAYTADVARLDYDRCRKAGFKKYFPKPMLPYKLLNEIDKLIMVKTD